MSENPTHASAPHGAGSPHATLFDDTPRVHPPEARLPFEQLKAQVEALLFASETSLTIAELRALLGEVSLAEVRMALRDLENDYATRAFFLYEFGGKYQLRTREEFSDLVRKQFASKARNLSKAALETLAIVAYKQPVTRAEINQVRQVDSSSILQSLKERDLVYVSGTRKEVGSPAEYRTTSKFLETFSLQSLGNLPSLRSLQLNPNERAQVQEALKSLSGESEDLPSASDLSFPDPESAAHADGPGDAAQGRAEVQASAQDHADRVDESASEDVRQAQCASQEGESAAAVGSNRAGGEAGAADFGAVADAGEPPAALTTEGEPPETAGDEAEISEGFLP